MKHPHIPDAPGLAWRPLKAGWQASWRARADLIKRGWPIRYRHLWAATAAEPEPSPAAAAMIHDQCQQLQTEMLVWGRGGVPIDSTFDGTWRSLVTAYQTDEVSSYRKVRYRTRVYYDCLCRRIERDHGDERVQDFKVRDALLWHQQWAADGEHIPLAHSLMGMIRTLVNFGADFLEDDECVRVAGVLHRRKFEQGKAREEHLSA